MEIGHWGLAKQSHAVGNGMFHQTEPTVNYMI